MDLSPIKELVFTYIWYAIPIAILTIIVKSPWFKGSIGELMINLSAKLLLDKKRYRMIKNVTLPTEDGSTQIDHIIVSVFGVFVIETKNMKGWIFGSESQRQWTQKIFKHSNSFQNPLHQNYKHLKTLQSLLNLREDQIHSLIVFVGDNQFKTPMPANVTQGGGYIRYIKSKTIPVLQKQEVRDITIRIKQGRLSPSFKTSFEHVKHVQEIVERKKLESSPRCPKCDGDMVLRTSKKGANLGNSFWGCSTFPVCKGVLKNSDS
jgi:restriction system protein